MDEINDNQIKSILYDISKKLVLPKFNNLRPEEIKLKNDRNLVTEVDLQVEESLNKFLCSLLPNSLFVGEEKFTFNPKILENYHENKYCWTVDPIDGTSNFVKGKDNFAIMIALSFKEKILQSWIYKPLTEEFCFAKLQNGTYINEKKIKIFNNNSYSDSSGSISSKHWENDYVTKMLNIKNLFKEVKSYGCIGLEYVDIAKSQRDFVILSKLSPWDHIPGILIIREAGGIDNHFDNTNYQHNIKKNNLVVTGSTKLNKEIFNLIRG